MNEIGNLIKERRLELKLTLEEVGEAVGVGKSTVRKWETGLIKNMKRDKIALLAKSLDISPALLVPSADEDALSPNETRLVTLYRGADDRAQRDAVRILEDNQKEETASEKMA